MPPPPGGEFDLRNRRYKFVLSGRPRGALTEQMAALNVSLIAVKQLTNLQQLERLLKQEESAKAQE